MTNWLRRVVQFLARIRDGLFPVRHRRAERTAETPKSKEDGVPDLSAPPVAVLTADRGETKQAVPLPPVPAVPDSRSDRESINVAPQVPEPGGEADREEVRSEQGPQDDSSRAAPPSVGSVDIDASGHDSEEKKVDEIAQEEDFGQPALPTSGYALVSSETPKRPGRVEPARRGGRPRGSDAPGRRDDSTIEPGPKSRGRPPKPELVCWRKGMNWALGVEVPDSLSAEEWDVRHGAAPLEEDEQRSGRWVLCSPCGAVTAQCGDAPVVVFAEEPFRLFKLSGASCDRGRYMRSLTNGRFLIVAPEEWQPSQPMIDAAFLDSEYVVGACRAHHVELSSAVQDPMGFTTPDGELKSVPITGPAFEFQGDLVSDTHATAGPLFGGEPPHLRNRRDALYRTVVVGHEGSRESSARWQESSSDFEELRPEIASRRAGWFFVRLYNEVDQLIESLDFRYAAGLQGIEREAGAPMPSSNGHATAPIKVVHDAHCQVIPLGAGAVSVSVNTEEGGTRVELPPLPIFDETLCLVEHRGGGQVEIGLGVDRVWWSVLEGPEDETRLDWTDRPLELRAADLAATSQRLLRIRLPRAWAGTAIDVGVAPYRTVRARPLPRRRREAEVPFPWLGRFPEVTDGVSGVEIKLWGRSPAGDMWNGVVGRLIRRIAVVEPSERLHLDALSPVSAMRFLTRLRRQCRGRGCGHRALVDGLRRRYDRLARHPNCRSDAQRQEFICEAVCALALVQDEHLRDAWSPRMPARWIRRARAAATGFPMVLEGLKHARPWRE